MILNRRLQVDLLKKASLLLAAGAVGKLGLTPIAQDIGVDVKSVIKLADMALCTAKKQGRNKVLHYESKKSQQTDM